MTPHESSAAPSRRAASGEDEQATGVVALLQDLAPHLAAEPDPAYRLATRQRLVAMAAVRTPEPARPPLLRRLLAARVPDAPATPWRTRAVAGLAGAALTVTCLATLVALSTAAGPGDALYAVKRGTEQTQLALAGDSRGQVLLDLARTRLDELRDLGGDAALAGSTLDTMDGQTLDAAAWLTSRALETSDPAPLDRLSGWAVEQSTRLDAAQTPPGAAADVEESRGLLADVIARAYGLRTVLDCPAGPAVSGTDRLGPVPAAGGCPPADSAPLAPGPGEPGGPTAVPSPPPAASSPGGQSPVPPLPTAGPTGPPPVTGAVPTPAPGIPSRPVPAPPTTQTTPPGLPVPPTLPPLLPEVLTPAVPPAPASPPAPPLGVRDGELRVCLPPLLTVGCRPAP